MKKLFLILSLLAICEIQVFSQTGGATALNFLSRNEPGVKWNIKSQISGDFNYDGAIDYALRGRRGKSFVLGIVKSAPGGKRKYQTLRFGEDAGEQGALCSVESAVIAVEDLDKDYVEFAAEYLEPEFVKMLKNLPKNSKGINVSDGMCDSFHVIYDKKANELIWWRI